MSGHSHWSSIKHKKAKVDAKRGQAFSRLVKNIMTAVRAGGKDPDMNLDLRYAVDAAKSAGVPKENIERAVLKGAGELEGQAVEAVRYEGYGPGGAAVMVDALTDNRNRTTPHVRKVFASHGGEMGATGCVAWTFESKGLVLVPSEGRDENEMFELAIEAGADDFQPAGDLFELSCAPKALHKLREGLKGLGIDWESAEITMVPRNYVKLSPEDGRKVLKMMEEFEEDEDVSNVYSNFDLPEELTAEMEE